MADLPHVINTRVPAMAWCRHENDDDFVYWSPSTRVIGSDPRWPDSQILRDRRTSNTPSISGSGPGACMAWKGSGNDTHIWYSLWDTAANTWGPQIPTRFETQHFPTVVRYRDRTFMFWNNCRDGDNGIDEIVWAELVNGGWVNPNNPSIYDKSLLGIATDGIAATWHTQRDALYIAWRGHGADTTLHWWELDTASGWDEHGTVPNGAASAPPALMSDGNAMYLAWRNDENDHISWTWSIAGNWMPPQVLTDRRTSAGPTLGVLGTTW